MSESSPPRILLVDDDDRLIRMMRLTLLTEDFDVVTAPDGIVALEKLEARDFDVIVLDLQMPRMGGRECFRALRAGGKRMPVIIVSASNAEEVCAELGADQAINKPFDPHQLVRAVRALLATSTVTPGARKPKAPART